MRLLGALSLSLCVGLGRHFHLGRRQFGFNVYMCDRHFMRVKPFIVSVLHILKGENHVSLVRGQSSTNLLRCSEDDRTGSALRRFSRVPSVSIQCLREFLWVDVALGF